ncbi:signal recognition particle-docking protein FtsY, partial [Actinomyces oris]
MEPILIVLGIILVIVIGGGLWLYAGRRRGQVPDEISAHEPMSVEDLLPSEGEDTEEEAEGEPAATLESPESIPGRMQRLRARLAGAGGFGKAVLSVLSRGDLTEEDWEEIEDTLLTSDLGIEVTTSLMDELRTQAKVLGTSDPEAVRAVLRAELLKLVDPSLDRSLNLERPAPAEGAQGTPAAAILMVGVNGTGKTT